MVRSILECRQFQSFQWFDGPTMSGFILNCCAPFKALRRFKVQEFKETLAVQAIPPLRLPKRIRSNWLFHWTIPLGINYYGAGDEF